MSPSASLPGGSSQHNTSGRYCVATAGLRPAAATPLAQLPLHRLGVPGARRCLAGLASRVRTPAAYGDLIAAVLALLALAVLPSRLGIVLVWAFNLWGSVDLLYAFYQGVIGVGLEPGQLGAAYFIPTVVVPLLLITHGLVFRLLLRGDGVAASRDG